MYDAKFYDDQVDGSYQSARVIVPHILNRFRNIRSVVDVGCGHGTWLQAFIENGVSDVAGIDGDYVDKSKLRIPSHLFISHNLEHAYASSRSFDCCISLEVAEHLNASSSDSFVESLVGLSDMIVFSAAIPGQGGTNHINERDQSYWVSLFSSHGYIADANFRLEFWNNRQVCPWYAQNIIIFAKCQKPPANQQSNAVPYNLVHPSILQNIIDNSNRTDSVPVALRKLIMSIRCSVLHRISLSGR